MSDKLTKMPDGSVKRTMVDGSTRTYSARQVREAKLRIRHRSARQQADQAEAYSARHIERSESLSTAARKLKTKPQKATNSVPEKKSFFQKLKSAFCMSPQTVHS